MTNMYSQNLYKYTNCQMVISRYQNYIEYFNIYKVQVYVKKFTLYLYRHYIYSVQLIA